MPSRETYCSNSKGGEIYDPISFENITENSVCVEYGDCEVIFGGCFDDQGVYISNHNNYECNEGTTFNTTNTILYSNNEGIMTESICSNYSQVGEMLGYPGDLLFAENYCRRSDPKLLY